MRESSSPGTSSTPSSDRNPGGTEMDIKILGSGCAKCEQLEAATRAAAEELGVRAELEKVTDPAEIASRGVMSTPALVVDDEVLVSGRVLTTDEVVSLLGDR
ncbi:MAG: thioredoxin family protein [Acidimicrobiales bacterium]